MTLRNDSGDLRVQSKDAKSAITLKADTGFVGINSATPSQPLEVNGSMNLNGNSLYFPSAQAAIYSMASPGIFWHGANLPANEILQYGLYKTAGPWSGNYQQLRLQFETGIQLGAGTGVNAGYGKSYVEVVNGKGLMVTSGNLGVGTNVPSAKAHVITAASDADMPSWNNGQFVVGLEPAYGAGSGGVGLSYNAVKEIGYLMSVSPGLSWRDLGFRAKATIFYASGVNEAMRLTADGRLGIGINAPTHQLHVRRDANEGVGTWISNKNAGNAAFTISNWETDSSVGVIFKNSSTRTADGGINTMTVRNDGGDLRLLATGSVNGLQVKAGTGNVGIGTSTPLSVLGVAGNLTIGLGKAGNTAAPVNGLFVEGDTILSNFLYAQKGVKMGLYDFGNVSSLELQPGDGSPIGNRIIFGTDNTGWKLTIAKRLNTSKAITDLVTVNDNGNVGIGTIWPAGKLHVVTASSDGNVAAWDAGQFVVGQEANAGVNSGGLGLSYSPTTNTGYISALSPSTAWRNLTFRASNITFNNGGTENMRLASDGKLGLGTANPQHKLQMNGGNLAFYASEDPGQQNQNGYPNLGSIIFYGHGRSTVNDSARIVCGSSTWDDQGYLAFQTSQDGDISLERMRIAADGKIGIGTNAPSGKVHIASTGKVIDGQGLFLGKTFDPIRTSTVMGEVMATTDIGFAGYRDNEPNQVGAKISAIRLSNHNAPNYYHLIQAMELAFYTGNGGTSPVNHTLHETCVERFRINKDGGLLLNSTITNAHARPAVTKDRQGGEFGAYSSQGFAADDGFMRISAGGGTSWNVKSYIDLSGYSTIPDMNCNMVFGTAGAERMRINNAGYIGMSATPQAQLSLGGNGKEDFPDGAMHITNDCILFGGNNAYREANSCQISAGRHIGNSMNIVGMSDTGNTNRRVDMWAEGGFNLYGNLGIGTTSSYYPIHVARAVVGNIPSYFYLARPGTGNSGGWAGVSIWCADRVVASEFNAVSDARIKKNIKPSIAIEDMEMLLKIEVNDYQYRDFVTKGEKWNKGFVAQQVQEIFPEAVTPQIEFVPDIFAGPVSFEVKEKTVANLQEEFPATTTDEVSFGAEDKNKTVKVLYLTMENNHNLKSKQLVRVISNKGFAEKPARVVNKKTFAIEDWNFDTDDLFVYGRQVDDFMVVDYNRIYSLNVSATQELHRQVATLKAENENLLKQVEAIKKALGTLNINIEA